MVQKAPPLVPSRPKTIRSFDFNKSWPWQEQGPAQLLHPHPNRTIGVAVDGVVHKKLLGTLLTSLTSPDGSGASGAGPVVLTFIMAQMIADAKDKITTKQQARRIPWEATPEETPYI